MSRVSFPFAISVVLLIVGVATRAGVPATAEDRRSAGDPSSNKLPAWSATPAIPAALQAALAHVSENARPADDGSYVIENAAYRAHFSADGWTAFTPRDGETLARHQTWRYRLRGLHAGATRGELPSVRPAAHGHIVEFPRPGLVERYIAGKEGIEQVFVIQERPAGAGDLRLEGIIETEGLGRSQGDGVQYGVGDDAIAYAPPKAFDATSRALPVRAEVQGGRLDLVVEETALASAVFPVTIDPIIKSASALVSTAGVNQVDVTYNWARSEFLAVYVYRGYSQVGPAPTGLRGQRFDAAGTPIESSFFIHSGDDQDVSVAYSMQLDRYLVVWPDAGVHDVFGQFLASDGQLLGLPFQVNDQAGIGTDATNPDVVARNFGPPEGLFMVVYQTYGASGAMGTWFRPISSMALGEERLSSANNSVTTQPAVDYDPNEDRFMAVWDTTAGLFVRSIFPDGATGAELTVIDGAERPSSPAIAYDSGSRLHLVAWSADYFGTQAIRGRFLMTAFQPALAGNRFSIHSGGATKPAVTAETGSFVVAHEQRDGIDVPRWKPDSNIHAERIYAHPNFDYEFSFGYLYQDLPGVSPRQDDLWPAIATGGYGFSLFSFQHNPTVLNNEVPDGQLAAGLALGQFTHFVHGRSGDIGGSSAADMLVFRPATGHWYMAPGGSNGLAMHWGEAGDMPVLMDVTQDGQAEIGVWRPSNGVWYLANDTRVVSVVQWGAPGDVPVPGDYIGDAADDYAVWRPSTGVWFIRDGTTAAVSALLWGEVGDVPVPADYDGDGKVDPGVWRPSTGYWYTTRGTNGNNGQAVQWGEAGDIPLQGNFVGDHRADQVVFRPRLGMWYRRDGLTGEGSVVRWGESGDIPMPGDFDADGRLDTVVWRAATGTWHILRSSGGVMAQIWGEPGDIPISGMSR